MKTLTLEAEIEADGTLRLAVPSGLSPGRVEVVLVLQTKQNGPATQESMKSTATTASTSDKWDLLAALMKDALVDVSWSEIEEGRRDRDFGG